MSPIARTKVYVKAERHWLVLVYVAVVTTVILVLLVQKP